LKWSGSPALLHYHPKDMVAEYEGIPVALHLEIRGSMQEFHG